MATVIRHSDGRPVSRAEVDDRFVDHRKFNLRVFDDPITQKRFEGSAALRKINFADEPNSYCEVEFSDGAVVDRWIDNEQLKDIGAL